MVDGKPHGYLTKEYYTSSSINDAAITLDGDGSFNTIVRLCNEGIPEGYVNMDGTSVYLLRQNHDSRVYCDKLRVTNQYLLGKGDDIGFNVYLLAVCVRSVEHVDKFARANAPFNFELERLDMICNRLMRLP